MTGLRQPLERVSARARLMWTASALLEAVAVLAVLGLLLHWVDRVRLVEVVVGLAVVTAYAVLVPQWRWRVHRWEVTDTAVYTQTGWWSRERRIAPISRVQTVDMAEGPLERLFGLATVTVTTASAAGALRIEGLDRALAQRLTDRLTQQADSVLGDAT